MGLVALVLVLVGFIGTVLTFFRVAIHAYKEQGPLWGLLCLLVPSANLAWGAIHWNDEDARGVRPVPHLLRNPAGGMIMIKMFAQG